MIGRIEIRYGNFWIRLICSLAVAVGVGNAVFFSLLDALEEVARTLIVEPDVEQYIYASRFEEIIAAFCSCIIFSLFHIEEPWTMTACCFAMAMAYVLGVVMTAILFGMVLPIVSPLLGILLASVLLGTMAWSEERDGRKQLEQLERAKQEFTDMLVHDLRRRMSSILMSFSLLEKGGKATEGKTEEITGSMRLIAERALIQINDLLAIRRIEESKLKLDKKKTSLRRFLKRSILEHQLACEVVGTSIKLLDGEDCEIEIDEGLISRVLANLLWNALEHAEAGSEIQVGCELKEAGGVQVFVANKGKPIPRELQDKLFEAFVSERKESSLGNLPAVGLGLAFCKLALEAHGASIAIESPFDEAGGGVKVSMQF
ncbi:hypothetical protein BVX97_03460 [bacterium E08(2017)]|nr:hypothetical protein BVX97_03460 [bacterium E08(2017)]